MDYDKYISRAGREIPPSGIRKFFDIVAEMDGAISLGVGEPDFITPWSIRDAAIRSLQKGYTQYTSNSGLFELRVKIAEYLKMRFDAEYDPKGEIVLTSGASEAIDVALRSIIDVGDEVLIPSPSYVSYAPAVTLCGGKPVPVECFAEDCFKVTAENLEKAITPKTKALLISYPNNPTGAIMTREELLALCPIVEKYDLLVISDEIYAELTYEGTHCSFASLPAMKERVILVSGFSKAFAMTGWRLGYMAMPVELCKIALKIHQYVIMCAPTMSQYAALSGLTQGIEDGFSVVEEMRSEYDMRRRYVVKTLRDMGFECFEPHGAFYVFPSVKSFGMTGEEFSERLLASKKVAVVPGNAFGECGKYFIRISYAYSMKSLEVALSKIAEFLKEEVAGK